MALTPAPRASPDGVYRPDDRAWIRNDSQCPACGASRLSRAAAKAADTADRERIQVFSCRRCGLAWQWPDLRNTEESRNFFEAAFRDASAESYFDPSQRRAVATMQWKYVKDLVPSARSLIDFGCGDGTFARVVAQAGIDVVGIDPARPPEARVEEGRGWLEFRNTAPTDVQFDIVTLWDVVEHLERPLQTLREALGLLRRGGVLLVETGNHASWDRLVNGPSWSLYQADHRWYFTPSTLCALLDAAGAVDVVACPITLRPWAPTSPPPEPSFSYVAKTALQAAAFGDSRFLQSLRDYRQLRGERSASYSIFVAHAKRA